MTAYQWYVTVVASVACLCAAVMGLTHARCRRDLRALRRLLSDLPRCGMACDGGSENRTCSCRGPANCQPDLRRFEVLRRAHERPTLRSTRERADRELARASASVDERPPDQNARTSQGSSRRTLLESGTRHT